MIRFDLYDNGNLSGMPSKSKISGDHPGAGKPAGIAGNLQNPPFYGSLDRKMDFDAIFSVVKTSVKAATGRERSGIGLAMSDLPATLGAFWQIGGNYIVMNEVLVHAMSEMASGTTEFNSYVYMILTHEYLHSLGFTDEMEARKMTAMVAAKSFGEDHPAFTMSNGDLWTLYPGLRNLVGGRGENIRIINNFDSSATSYIA